MDISTEVFHYEVLDAKRGRWTRYADTSCFAALAVLRPGEWLRWPHDIDKRWQIEARWTIGGPADVRKAHTECGYQYYYRTP